MIIFVRMTNDFVIENENHLVLGKWKRIFNLNNSNNKVKFLLENFPLFVQLLLQEKTPLVGRTWKIKSPDIANKTIPGNCGATILRCVAVISLVMVEYLHYIVDNFQVPLHGSIPMGNRTRGWLALEIFLLLYVSPCVFKSFGKFSDQNRRTVVGFLLSN